MMSAHEAAGSHNEEMSSSFDGANQPGGGISFEPHDEAMSQEHKATGSHDDAMSVHKETGSHDEAQSLAQHEEAMSEHDATGSHDEAMSQE